MDGTAFHGYDVLMIVVLIGATVFGAWKGLAWQVATVGSVVLSFFVAIRFGSTLAPYFSTEEPWNKFIAMLVLYLVSTASVWLAFSLISKVEDQTNLRGFDRQVGAMLGMAGGLLLCLVLTFFTVTLSESARQAVLTARSGYYAALFVHRATPLMPDEVRTVLGKYIDELDRKLDPNTPAAQPGSGLPTPSQLKQLETPMRVLDDQRSRSTTAEKAAVPRG